MDDGGNTYRPLKPPYPRGSFELEETDNQIQWGFQNDVDTKSPQKTDNHIQSCSGSEKSEDEDQEPDEPAVPDESDVSIETNESDVSVESDDQGLLDADGNTGRGSRRGPLHLHQEGSQMWGCDVCPEMNWIKYKEEEEPVNCSLCMNKMILYELCLPAWD